MTDQALRPSFAAALLLGAAVALAACSKRAPEIRTIAVDNLAFGPAPAGLHVGDTVEWTNRDPFLHSVTDPERQLDLPLQPGGKARLALKKAGVISYFCRYHPGMKGRIEVAR
jgi:plastocyanin